MRAQCESCGKPQPVDWQAGDLCVHCGEAVREEARCHWCVRQGPRGKFCRSCGAVAVAREHFGAARILKSMGASVFEIPKYLAEMEEEQIATYQSMYGVQAAAANRHIEYVRELSARLYLKQWAKEMEDELLPQLPWADELLEKYTKAPLTWESPFRRVRELALLTRIQEGDFRALRETAALVYSGDAAIAAEAALQFSGWRALYCVYTEINRHDLLAVLRESPMPALAAPRRAALGEEPEPEYGPTGDADTDFLILILDRQSGALEMHLDSRDPMRRYVAASQLIRFQRAGAIGPALRAADEARQLELCRDIVRYKLPVETLHADLFAVMQRAEDPRVRQAAAQAISLGRRHADFVRLLELAGGDTAIIQTLLRARPEPETYLEIGRRLVESGHFRAEQWGLDAAAKPGGMPLGFVEEMYPHTGTRGRAELLGFAEKQIEAHGAEQLPLERFLIRQCFAGGAAELTGTAWACMHRIQMHREVGRNVPFELTAENVGWCWEMPEFLQGVARLMADPEAVRQTFVRDDFDRFLRSADEEVFEAAAGFPFECGRVIAAAPAADPYTYCVRFAAELQARLADLE